jgi:hypothetical protein
MNPNHIRPQLIDPTVWLITGVLIGTLFHAPTAIALIICWLVIRNNPLPEVIGGKHPQDIIVDLVNMGWLLVLRIFSNRHKLDKDTATAVVAATTAATAMTTLLHRTVSTPTMDSPKPNVRVPRTIRVKR